MKINFYTTAREFLSQVGYLLIDNEARYGLINGLAKRLSGNPHYYGQESPWFCAVSDGGEILAAAMRTPPYMVILAYFSGDRFDIAGVLVESVSRLSKVIPGAVGDLELAEQFSRQWCAQNNTLVKGQIFQRIYKLEKVNDIRLAPGTLRLASPTEKGLISRWSHSFYQDVYGSHSRNTPETDITPAIESGDVYLWEDGLPVSMVVKTRPTENGITVGGVYTPPNLRRRGYATSSVATLCRGLLHSHYNFCTLYTDLSNPTSNSIYKKIGFKYVCDSAEYSFYGPQ